MKQTDIKDLSIDDLNENLVEHRDVLSKLKMNHAVMTNVQVPKKYAVRSVTDISGLSSNFAWLNA